jgi:hypothetical protein
VRQLSLLDTHDVVRIKLIGNGAVTDTGNHRSHAVSLLYKVLGTYRVKKTLTKRNVSELDAIQIGMRAHGVRKEILRMGV